MNEGTHPYVSSSAKRSSNVAQQPNPPSRHCRIRQTRQAADLPLLRLLLYSLSPLPAAMQGYTGNYHCTACASGSIAPTTGRRTCIKCSAHKTSNTARTYCGAPPRPTLDSFGWFLFRPARGLRLRSRQSLRRTTARVSGTCCIGGGRQCCRAALVPRSRNGHMSDTCQATACSSAQRFEGIAGLHSTLCSSSHGNWAAAGLQTPTRSC